MISRRRRAALAIALTGLLSISAGPSAAAQDRAACYGAGGATLTPGVTTTPRAIEIEGEIALGPCLSSIPTITSGTLRLEGSGPAMTCLRPGVSGTATVEWNDGSVSEMVWIGSSAPPPALAVIARITGGTAFVGNDLIIPGLTMGDPTECNTPEGVTSVEFVEIDFFI